MRLVRQDVRPHQSGPKAALSRIGRASLLKADETARPFTKRKAAHGAACRGDNKDVQAADERRSARLRSAAAAPRRRPGSAVLCVKFSKIDYGIRPSHPLGAAVARLRKSVALASDGGGEGGVHPLGGPEHRQAAGVAPPCAPSADPCLDGDGPRARPHGARRSAPVPALNSSRHWGGFARHRFAA
ncbi:hypothetical protein ABIF65_010257 [Bradyrhizobium japonicum]|nr:hypothetical protein [Bradyrhizobium japonicum]MCP1866197.1 hypothetical protein [Bradyrhizobium japonicum]MCP1896778.1 hypothetical protein [Bradyrhizobium japonicum]MCW2330167.1 hypothetical protein [Bradyrhizobium japonicum]